MNPQSPSLTLTNRTEAPAVNGAADRDVPVLMNPLLTGAGDRSTRGSAGMRRAKSRNVDPRAARPGCRRAWESWLSSC